MSLLEFKTEQINALQKRVHELEVNNLQLSTWVFELADDDTPKEYKELVLQEYGKYTVDLITNYK